ncbi:hypothetical protein N0V82_003158 [Gnomoniopsis sp. IMI 355080]|nr:hypothetical protein N0V82_003158 [Gnomoniopsis sp. IMI 355080]
MGLGAKIKEALHSDHSTTTTQSNTASHTTPGAFPSDELPQRNADGKNYTAPHGTAVDDTINPGTHTGATSGLTSSGTPRNRLSKGTDDQDQTKGAYWGDLSKDGHSGTAGDFPDRTRPGEDTSDAAGRQHRAQGHHHDHRSGDQAVGGGVYDSVPARGSHGASNRDPTEDSHFGQNLPGTSTSRDHHLAGQSSGGGTFNSVTGSGSPGHHATRNTPRDTVHDPLSSGTKGVPLSSGHTSGEHYDHQRAGFQGDGASTAHNDRAGHSHGLGATGAAAGAGAAAGYGAHEYGQHNNGNPTHSGNKTSGGVPRTSMLDPEPASNRSNLAASGHPGSSGYNDAEGTRVAGTGANSSPDRDHRGTATHGTHGTAGYGNAAATGGSGVTGYNDPTGTHGTHNSRIANAVDPRIDSDRDHRGAPGAAGAAGTSHIGSGPGPSANTDFSGNPSHVNTNIGAGSGPNSSISPTQSASSGSGQKHYGPGHEGAKVLHSCQHCGRDNDISHYFNKDVVYRLGQ